VPVVVFILCILLGLWYCRVRFMPRPRRADAVEAELALTQPERETVTLASAGFRFTL
tara:strand:+ start:135 stop:305 length:171 start_codon:yes stop_codon:yes gene_type:complete